MDRHALIAGVSGIIGRHLADHLIGTKGWTVTGISRHKHNLPKGVKHISVDLRSDEALARRPAHEGHGCIHHRMAAPAHGGRELPRECRHGAQSVACR
jgi:nucleoside-diphosphate-sugar epimerase